MGRFFVLLYGTVIYVIFVVTFVYAMGFVGGIAVPKTIDSGVEGAVLPSILINIALLGLFAVQHIVMARPEFKTRWTKIVPKPIERSTFVLATCLCLGLTFWQWRPMTGIVWHVEQPLARGLLIGVSLFGWLLVLYSSFLIDHFDLFGLRQVVLYWRQQVYTHRPFVERSLYKWVQHPLMVGFLIAFWATPTMTAGHLLFAVVTTAYIVVGTRIEERDLARMLGDDYHQYRARTARFLPRPKRPKAVHVEVAAAKT
ncbi:MAG: methanethiol S-methyltransferase [Planctomycetota bacterium]|jgi:protein-S-isoprenylcysteine O-methyltransferase Ste14